MSEEKRILSDGNSVPKDYSHTEIDPSTGMQKGYVVLTPEERAKGFVRPVRTVYYHNKCRSQTRMGTAIAETYARDPKFYNATMCVKCKNHFPLDEFTWEGTNEMVGS